MRKIVCSILLGLLIGCVLISVLGTGQTQDIGLEYVKGKRIKVPVGEKVTVYTTVKATGGSISGTLKVEIRKDKVGKPDETVKYLSKYISLSEGETKEFEMGYFTASDKTGTGWGKTRQYFVRVYFNDKIIHNPQNPNTRECVETYEVPGQIQYKKTEFAAEEGYEI